MFAYAGTLRIVLYDARTDSDTFGRLNVLHLGGHDRALVSIPWACGTRSRTSADEAAFINMPSQPYRHDDPDKVRLPLENVIPCRLTRR